MFFTIFIFYCNHVVNQCAQDVIEDISRLPEARAAVLFGCNRLTNGNLNRFYLARIKAAVALYDAGKIKKILVSGDNGRKTYNEPDDMKADLIERGVPEGNIICDYAGFSTLDTVVRAQKVFGLNQFIVISQRFQCERAVYIGKHHQIQVIGFPASDVRGLQSKKTYYREYLARTKAWIDIHVTKRGPRFLGPMITV